MAKKIRSILKKWVFKTEKAVTKSVKKIEKALVKQLPQKIETKIAQPVQKALVKQLPQQVNMKIVNPIKNSVAKKSAPSPAPAPIKILSAPVPITKPTTIIQALPITSDTVNDSVNITPYVAIGVAALIAFSLF
jgi:hypothetical protein